MKKVLIITYSEDNECIDMVKTAVKEKNGETYRFNKTCGYIRAGG